MSEKFDIYQTITDKIIQQMENGVIPWHKSWHGVREGAFNRVSKKPYSLLNQMLLMKTGEYATFDQWSKLGGKIKKGAKSEIVVFWKILKNEKVYKTYDADGNEDGFRIEEHNIPMLRYYRVFHIDDVEGVKPLETFKSDLEPFEKAEEIIANYTTKDNLALYRDEASDRAYYSPSKDFVRVPMLSQFENIEEYYSTLFHELTHSTKHQNRLNRGNDGLAFFGSESYSKEELVAEIGACSMINYLGISTDKAFKNNVAYLQNWLQVLKNDKKFIVSASSQAQKAFDYILKFSEEVSEEETSEE